MLRLLKISSFNKHLMSAYDTPGTNAHSRPWEVQCTGRGCHMTKINKETNVIEQTAKVLLLSVGGKS